MSRRLLLSIAVVAACLMCDSALAQKNNIFRKTLANGLDVLVIPDPVVPLVTVEINVRNGAYTEGPEYTGLSHLYEHMFFKANSAIPSQEQYLSRLRELGASWNGTTSEERVNYFFTAPKDSLPQEMEFMHNAATSPLFLQEELVKERPVVTGELDRGESNPFFILFRTVNEKVWWKYFTRKNVIGDRQVILTATTEKMKTIQNRYYVPNNSALILSGDLTPEQGFALADRYFASWKRAEDPFVAYPVPDHPPIQKTETVVVERPINVVTIMMTWHGPSVGKDPKSTYAADVLSFILAQRTTAFYKAIVESGRAYGVNFNYQTLNHTGPITLMAQTSADSFRVCRDAILAELAKFTDPGYFSDEQLENAKTILAVDEQYNRERPSQYCHTVGYWWAVAGLDYYLNYVDNLRKVTRKDIDTYVQTYITGKPYVMGVLVSPTDRPKTGL